MRLSAAPIALRGARDLVRVLLAPLLLLLFLPVPAADAHSDEPPKDWPVLSKGSRGQNVVALNELLLYAGYSPDYDSTFDTSTDSAVRSFQQASGYSVDGIVGPQTWGGLTPTTSQGASGLHVAALTRLLYKSGISGSWVTTNINSTVKGWVQAFQTHMGLSSTGTVDSTTWRYLLFHYETWSLLDDGSRTCNGDTVLTPPSEKWGTSSMLAYLNEAGGDLLDEWGRRLAFRDLGFEHGGHMHNQHGSHRHGMDVDIRPATWKALWIGGEEVEYNCVNGLTYTSYEYSRTQTDVLYLGLKNASSDLGRDLHKLTFFNDPVLYDQYPEMSRCCSNDSPPYTSHNNHLHTRFCRAWYPASSSYDC